MFKPRQTDTQGASVIGSNSHFSEDHVIESVVSFSLSPCHCGQKSDRVFYLYVRMGQQFIINDHMNSARIIRDLISVCDSKLTI